MLSANCDLTICSVSLHDARYLALNWELTRQLNGGAPCKWLVAENTQEGEESRLGLEDRRFDVIAGVDAPQMNKYRGSYHHGGALNKIVARVKTRFALVLDPDFFIVRKTWIKDVIDHMVRNDLAFFGAPWHLRWYRKYRYFPCVHCVFIDSEKIDLNAVDWMPDLLRNPNLFVSNLWVAHERLTNEGRRLRAGWVVLRRPWRAVVEDLEQRRLIGGSSRDTGYQLFQRFGRQRGIKHEEVTPVFRPNRQSLMPPGVSHLQRCKLVELWLPDHWSYIPKRAQSFTRMGFRELGCPDVSSCGWEEFMWRKEPFGFHIRGFLQRPNRTESQDAEVARVLEALTGLTLQGVPNSHPFGEAGTGHTTTP